MDCTTPRKRQLDIEEEEEEEDGYTEFVNPLYLEQDLKRLKLEHQQQQQQKHNQQQQHINSSHNRPLSLNCIEMNTSSDGSPESVSSSWSVFACTMMSPIHLDNTNASEYGKMNQVLKECHFMRQRRKFQQDRDREHASFLASLEQSNITQMIDEDL